MNPLIENANNIQKDALAVIKNIELEKISSEIGQLNLVGSAVYNLMTWGDIDFDLITRGTPTDADYWKLAKSIFEIKGVRKLTLVDNRNSIETDRPKSMYIGVSYEDPKKKIWKLDIRLLSQEATITDEVARLINQKLTEETRIYILEIKSQVHNNPKYHKGFSSVDIYNAVLIHGVKTLDEFEKYLSTLGKSL